MLPSTNRAFQPQESRQVHSRSFAQTNLGGGVRHDDSSSRIRPHEGAAPPGQYFHVFTFVARTGQYSCSIDEYRAGLG